MKQSYTWRTGRGQQLQRELPDELRRVLLREKAAGHELKACIGTDSQVKGKTIEFATVIVFIRKGKGGFMFVRKSAVSRPMTIRERMLTEVNRTVELAMELSPLFARYQTELEVHADINTNPAFKSHDALKEAMGYILGMGYTFRAKPEAFASSCCANKMVQ